jgi:integrase
MLAGATAVWETRDPATGKRQQHSQAGFRTKRDAQAHLNTVIGKVAEGTWRPDKPITVKELLEDHWLPAKRSEGKEPATISQYENCVQAWLVPHLGAMRAAALTPKHVTDLDEKLATTETSQGRSKLSPRSRQAAIGTLKSAYKWGTENELLSRNPIAAVRRPGLPKKEVGHWDEEDAKQFLDATAEDRLRALWALALTRGFRRQELAGLCWDALDLGEEDEEEGTLRVFRTRVMDKGRPHEGTPKSDASKRTIGLDVHLVNLLKIHKGAQAEERMRLGLGRNPHGYVFTNELGRPYSPDWITRRFNKLVKALGLPRITLHGARHSYASALMAAGVNPKVVQQELGHSTVSITLETYGHFAPSIGRQAGAELSARLLG